MSEDKANIQVIVPEAVEVEVMLGLGAHATVRIARQDWERVIEKACDIANATESDGDPMHAIHLEAMMALLDELEAKYGPQSRILATRADYLDSVPERRALYEEALALARKANDTEEIDEIMDSINQLGQE